MTAIEHINGGQAVVKGWCPGALRPMRTGDGLLVRLRLSLGVVSPDLARSIAALAQRFGNGKLTLSARGNLQLRGVSEPEHADLIEALSALGVLDQDARAEAVRNILVSPLSGLDGSALQDARLVALALEQRIGADELFWSLPGKFSFVIEDGGAFSLAGIESDLRFVAVDAGSYGLTLGSEAGFFGLWSREDVPQIAARVVAQFVAARKTAPLRHMQDLVTQIGVAEMAARLGTNFIPAATKTALPGPLLGSRERWTGIALPFGLLDAQQLNILAEVAGAAMLRLTPWRAIVIESQLSASQMARLAAAGFIVDDDDPRRRLVACTGKPGCWQASVATLDDASRLAGLSAQLVHVSGCAKGCAHPRSAAFTFVGRDGLYDLVEEGSANATPSVMGVSPEALTSVLAARIALKKAELSRVL